MPCRRRRRPRLNMYALSSTGVVAEAEEGTSYGMPGFIYAGRPFSASGPRRST
jgi:hypothetical protein